jgi:hypothetical protein
LAIKNLEITEIIKDKIINESGLPRYQLARHQVQLVADFELVLE